MLLDFFKILGVLYLCCEIVCSIVGIAYLFDYLLSDLVQNKHSLLQESESDELFDRIWEDSAKHGPVNLEEYNKIYEYSIQKERKLTMDKIYRISCKIANGHDTIGYYRAETKKQLMQYLEQNNIHYDRIVNIHVTDISDTEDTK